MVYSHIPTRKGVNEINRLKNVLKNENVQIGIGIFICIGLIAGTFMLAPYIPDHNPDLIRTELKKQGYNVGCIECIKFELIENAEKTSGKVYQSSEPIQYKNEEVSLWLITSHYFHPFTILTTHVIEPYHLPDI